MPVASPEILNSKLAQIVFGLQGSVGPQITKDLLLSYAELPINTDQSSSTPSSQAPNDLQVASSDPWIERRGDLSPFTNTGKQAYQNDEESLRNAPLSSHLDFDAADVDEPADAWLLTPAASVSADFEWNNHNSLAPELRPLCTLCTCAKCTSGAHLQDKRVFYTPQSLARQLPREDLLPFLKQHWRTLQVDGLFHGSTVSPFPTHVGPGEPPHFQRLQDHLVLRHLEGEGELYQWRRAIAELRNLRNYEAFHVEATANRTRRKQTRNRGETDRSVAHHRYISHIFKGHATVDYDRTGRALKRDLRFGRRWSLLIEDFATADSTLTVPGLGPGIVLLCSVNMKKKMLVACPDRSYPSLTTYSYNPSKVRDSALRELVAFLHSQPHTVQICEILRPLAESLLQNCRFDETEDFEEYSQRLRVYFAS